MGAEFRAIGIAPHSLRAFGGLFGNGGAITPAEAARIALVGRGMAEKEALVASLARRVGTSPSSTRTSVAAHSRQAETVAEQRVIYRAVTDLEELHPGEQRVAMQTAERCLVELGLSSLELLWASQLP